jgi:hypothetical protein
MKTVIKTQYSVRDSLKNWKKDVLFVKLSLSLSLDPRESQIQSLGREEEDGQTMKGQRFLRDKDVSKSKDCCLCPQTPWDTMSIQKKRKSFLIINIILMHEKSEQELLKRIKQLSASCVTSLCRTKINERQTETGNIFSVFPLLLRVVVQQSVAVCTSLWTYNWIQGDCGMKSVSFDDSCSHFWMTEACVWMRGNRIQILKFPCVLWRSHETTVKQMPFFPVSCWCDIACLLVFGVVIGELFSITEYHPCFWVFCHSKRPLAYSIFVLWTSWIGLLLCFITREAWRHKHAFLPMSFSHSKGCLLSCHRISRGPKAFPVIHLLMKLDRSTGSSSRRSFQRRPLDGTFKDEIKDISSSRWCHRIGANLTARC